MGRANLPPPQPSLHPACVPRKCGVTEKSRKEGICAGAGNETLHFEHFSAPRRGAAHFRHACSGTVVFFLLLPALLRICQNFQISQQEEGEPYTPNAFAKNA